jgi:cytochrome c biogenesis protein CcmG, thiol:disulfide interchange protein DsbE
MRKFVLPGVIALVAVAALALLAFGVSRNNDTSSIDSKVAADHFPVPPDYTTKLQMLGSDKRISLAGYRGKVVVMNVFASWCDACKAEANLLRHEQKVLAAHGGTVLGVSYNDAAPDTESFDRQYHVTYPVVHDANGHFVQSFGTDMVPETFVIGRDGRIQALDRGEVTAEWFNRHMPKILDGAS